MNDFENCNLTQDLFPNLEFLDLSSNKIKKLDLKNVHISLKKLNLGGNQLKEIKYEQCIQNLTNLNLR